jgi:peroxiredoxin Q/BCP
MTLKIGDKAPDFEMLNDFGAEITLSDYKGQSLLLYFYPKDNTSGCTKQACAFSDDIDVFEGLKCHVLGISKDGVDSHKHFKEKHGLKVDLASDENGSVCELYGVWKEKNMYGKKYMGIERTSFLIDRDGIIQEIWRKVKIDNHVNEVINRLKEL